MNSDNSYENRWILDDFMTKIWFFWWIDVEINEYTRKIMIFDEHVEIHEFYMNWYISLRFWLKQCMGTHFYLTSNQTTVSKGWLNPKLVAFLKGANKIELTKTKQNYSCQPLSFVYHKSFSRLEVYRRSSGI